MKAFIFIGEQGRGKSTKCKELIKKFGNKSLYAYDPNAEYIGFKNKIKGLPSRKQFVEIATTVKNSVVVYEEATGFFNNKMGCPLEVVDSLVRNFHTKNIIIFNFHTLRSVPVEIMDFVQFINLFHTNDRFTLIKNKFRDDEELLKIFSDVYEKTFGTDKNRLTNEYIDEKSKQYYHYSRMYAR